MQNEYAIKLTEAANKYLAYNKKHFSGDKEMVTCVVSDYEDLMSIVARIEMDEDRNKIAKAMWDVDTAVRDVIPNKVYKAYTEE